MRNGDNLDISDIVLLYIDAVTIVALAGGHMTLCISKSPVKKSSLFTVVHFCRV